MKKFLVCLLALMLAAPAAMAEIRVETATTEYSPIISDATNCYYMRVDGGYQLFNADGEAISDVFRDMSSKNAGRYYQYTGSGVNYMGLLNARGQVISEPAYGSLYFPGNNWMLGYVLEPTTADTGDFSNRSTGEKFMMQRADLYYDGRLLGSLTRDEFNPSLRFGISGNYFYVRLTNETGYWIDLDFNITHVEKDFTSSEFTTIYKKGVFHNPTQQFAYCEGCPLTAADTNQTVYYDADKQQLLDLQGQVVASNIKYDSARLYGNYFLTRLDGLYGVMDKQGNVIVEPVYKDIAYGSADLLANGILTALTKEGHLHFINQSGEVTATAEYPLTSNDYKGYGRSARFAAINNLGKYIIITCDAGELPTRYEDIATPENQHKILMVKKNGLWGAIDTYGNTVLPFIHRYTLELTNDSTLALGSTEANERFLYRITYDDDAAPAAEATPAPAAAQTQDGSWNCDCGSVNSGKFCGNCGSAKPTPAPTATPAPTSAPADDGSWTCSCGSVNGGKFCPECGSPKPAATAAPELQCAECGYKPEAGAAPRFCPECGVKF